jgi:hypothetical protein
LLVCFQPIFIFRVGNYDLLAINFVFNLIDRSFLLASNIAFKPRTMKHGENLGASCCMIVFAELI